MSYAGDCPRVYAPTGRVAHLLYPGDQASAGSPAALCRLRVASWLGTGDQAEYDRAGGLPLCSRCETLAAVAGSAFAREADVGPSDSERAPSGSRRSVPAAAADHGGGRGVPGPRRPAGEPGGPRPAGIPDPGRARNSLSRRRAPVPAPGQAQTPRPQGEEGGGEEPGGREGVLGGAPRPSGMDAVRAEIARQAKESRNRRGNPRSRRAASQKYVPGSIRWTPRGDL